MVPGGENKRWPRQIVSQFGIRLDMGRSQGEESLSLDSF